MIVNEDFENWNVNSWTEWTWGNGVLTVPSAPAKKEGVYGMHCEVPATAGLHGAQIQCTWTNIDDTLYIDLWFRINSTTVLAGNDMLLMMIDDVSAGYTCYVDVHNVGGTFYICFWTDNYPAENPYANKAVTVGTYHHLQIKLRMVDNASGIKYFKLDDTVLCDETGDNEDADYFLDKIYIGVYNIYTTGDCQMQIDYDDIWLSLAGFRPDIPKINPFMRTCSDIDIDFAHVLEWEESRTRIIKRKRVVGKCPPTVEARHFTTMPRKINIVCRVNRAEKEELWDAYRECCWMPLYDRGERFVDWVWLEEPSFKWDLAVGCSEDNRPFIANLGLVCSST